MGKKTRNLKGAKHEVHRQADGTPSSGEGGGGDQEGSGTDNEKHDRIRGWYASLIPAMERNFSKEGKVEWHGKVYKVVDGKFIGYYLPLLPSEEKLSIQLDAVKKQAIKVQADAVAVIYYTVKMETKDDEKVKNQEHVELIFESEGFNKKYIWNVCRESGKLPWLDNGREDDHYEGGRLLA